MKKEIKKIRGYIGMMPDGKFSLKTIRRTKKEIIDENKQYYEAFINSGMIGMYVDTNIYPCEMKIKLLN